VKQGHLPLSACHLFFFQNRWVRRSRQIVMGKKKNLGRSSDGEKKGRGERVQRDHKSTQRGRQDPFASSKYLLFPTCDRRKPGCEKKKVPLWGKKRFAKKAT